MAVWLPRHLCDVEPRCPDYNLFQRRQERDLYCAVAQDKPVPRFLTSEVWQFIGSGSGVTRDLSAYREADARIGDHLTGFYLFYSCRHVKRRALREMDEAA